MANQGSNAIIPKARGMYAKRISSAEYEELMRRRTVPEVAAILKKHPYFADSLATLSPTDPHREQIEELLGMDIFYKYEALVHYDYSEESFADYFIIECEVREILRVLRMLSVGVAGRYIRTLPPFLEGQLRFDLFQLAETRSFDDVLTALRNTPYQRVLRPQWILDPLLKDYPAAEAAMIRYYYKAVFELADKHLTGRELQSVKDLFLQEAEIYNINVILRAKVFFGAAFTGEQIRHLLLPYTYRVGKRRQEELINARGLDALFAVYRQSGLEKLAGPTSPDEFDATSGRVLYHHAQRLLHRSASPSATVAAFVFFAKRERDNVINVVEGVRYGLTPEKIRALLRY